MNILMLATDDKNRANWDNDSGVASYPTNQEPFITDNDAVYMHVNNQLQSNKPVFAIGHYIKSENLLSEQVTLMIIERVTKQKTTFGFTYQYAFRKVRKKNVTSRDILNAKNKINYLIDLIDMERLMSFGISKQDWMRKVFIGGATESNDVVSKIASMIQSDTIAPKPWYDQFGNGDITITKLLSTANEVDGAIFVFGSDDQVTYRNTTFTKTRDNVILEFGMFLAVLGLKRVAVCEHRDVTSPSDIYGLFKIKYNNPLAHDYAAHEEIKKYIHQLISLGFK